MSYFNKFPLTVYEINGLESIVLDVLRRSMFISEYRPYTDLFNSHTIVDGETPQSIAMQEYGAADYHWVVLMSNEIQNPYFDWPMDQLDLQRYCESKYGPETMYMIKHWEANGVVVGEIKTFSPDIEWVPPTFDGEATAISFYDFEQQLNDSKRDIQILRPELLGEFVKQFEESINA